MPVSIRSDSYSSQHSYELLVAACAFADALTHGRWFDYVSTAPLPAVPKHVKSALQARIYLGQLL